MTETGNRSERETAVRKYKEDLRKAVKPIKDPAVQTLVVKLLDTQRKQNQRIKTLETETEDLREYNAEIVATVFEVFEDGKLESSNVEALLSDLEKRQGTGQRLAQARANKRTKRNAQSAGGNDQGPGAASGSGSAG